jgi:hypothetical protein
LAACKDITPSLAQQDSTSGWTSLKPRNIKNSHDTWEIAISTEFELTKTAGENVKLLMGFAAHLEQNTLTLSCICKPFLTMDLGLSCHGESLSTKLEKTLAEHYPNDKATGYKLGDIRGGFSLSQAIDLSFLMMFKSILLPELTASSSVLWDCH